MDDIKNNEAGEVQDTAAQPDAGADPQTQTETNDTNEGAQLETKEGIVITENEKAYGDALRRLLGVPEGEELGGLEERVTAFEKAMEAKFQAARDQVISAELKALSGYNTKLLDRLLDRSKLTVDDNGKVVGLEEAVKQIETEFPEVKLREEHKSFVPVNPAEGGFDGDGKMTLSKAMKYANDHPGADINSLI